MRRLVMCAIGATLIVAMAAGLSGCGGGGDSADETPGSAMIGASGGTVAGADGARVFVPPEAFAEPVTVRISRDSTGAPPLPTALKAAGPVYAITPHGGDFQRHVEVTIPLPAEPAADNEQHVLVTAEPGATRWTVLSGATPVGNALRVPVMHFSFFQIVTLADMRAPTLALVMDRVASVPLPGTTQISADYEFVYRTNQSWGTWSDRPNHALEMRLTHAAPALARRVAGAPAPRYCQPTTLGPAGARLAMFHNGTTIAPGFSHRPTLAAAASIWPRNRIEAAPEGFLDSALAGWWSGRAGLGVAHFWGQDQPRAGAWVDLGSNSASPAEPDRYTLPPAGNAGFDDEWIWYGRFELGLVHNGRIRIDASVATDCGFDVAAVPLAFRLNITGDGIFAFVPGVYPDTWEAGDSEAVVRTVRAGEDVELAFSNLVGEWHRSEDDNDFLQEVTSLAWETSTDGTNWRSAPELDPSVVVDTRWFDQFADIDEPSYRNHTVQRIWRMRFTGVLQGRSGRYRANACIRLLGAKPSGSGARPVLGEQCQAGQPYRLEVVLDPPTVTRQPVGQTVLVGETASLAVTIQGTPRPNLQWQKRSVWEVWLQRPWTNIPNATAATYTTPALTLDDNLTSYRVAYSNASGGGFTDVALVNVVAQLAPPAITAQPGSLNVNVGGTAVFAATVSGSAPLSYQWRRNGVDIAGANQPLLTLNNVTATNDGRYELVVSNRVGSATSEPAALVVTLGTPVALPPSIASPPVALNVPAGSAANFAVAVTGTGPYTYLWTREGAAQPVGSDAILAFASVQATDAGRYQVRVTNNIGTVLSAYAQLTVGPSAQTPVAPAIIAAPAAVAVFPGAPALFAVAASGSGPLTYQWRRDGIDIAGATAATLSIAAASSGDAGQYSVEVRNAAGTALSTPAPLVIIGAPAITASPQAANAVVGATASFAVTAQGDALRYQWTRNGVAIDGATAAGYTTPPLALADGGAVYAVVVYNGAGAVFSGGAALTVTPAVTAPTVAQQPADVTVTEGSAASLDVAFNGTPPFTVQFQRLVGGIWVDYTSAGIWNDNAMRRVATGSLTMADSGSQFRFVATNGAGSVTTRAAMVIVSAVATTPVARIAAAFRHTCGVRADGNAACWGYNSSAQIGTGNFNSQPTPQAWDLGETVVSVAAGMEASCALTTSGRVFCAASGFNGGVRTPVEKAGISGARQVVIGSAHICVLTTERTVWCWGNGSAGQLGNGGTGGSSLPVQVLGAAGGTALGNVTALAAGTLHTCAVLGDGSAACWGMNTSLQTGSVAGTDTTRAVVVQGLSGVDRLALGESHSCALLTDATVRCWGDNSRGQFGNGVLATTPSAVPTAPLGMSGVRDLASGTRHVCAVLTAGAVGCWGTAPMGGGNVTETRTSAVAVPGLSTVVALAAGFEHTCALRANGSLACWGANGEGQLGLGDTITRTTPSALPGVSFAAP